MKALKFANLLIIALALTMSAIGCKKKPTGVTPLPAGTSGSKVGDDGMTDLENRAGMDGQPIPISDRDFSSYTTEDRAAFADYTVYFGFDSALVQASEDYKLTEIAAQLNGNMSNAVRIEGYCDERGTEGYNLALGERRALSLREALVAAGVDPNRIDTISYGEQRPANPGHDEIAWSENRRGEFILLIP
jgi:peptidoglycan-associated lipoprotein